MSLGGCGGLVRQGRFHLVLRHDPEFDGPLEEALEMLQRTFQAQLGESFLECVHDDGGPSRFGLGRFPWFVPCIAWRWPDLFTGVTPVARNARTLACYGLSQREQKSAELFATNLAAIERRDRIWRIDCERCARSHLRRNEGSWEIQFRRHWVSLGQTDTADAFDPRNLFSHWALG